MLCYSLSALKIQRYNQHCTMAIANKPLFSSSTYNNATGLINQSSHSTIKRFSSAICKLPAYLINSLKMRLGTTTLFSLPRLEYTVGYTTDGDRV